MFDILSQLTSAQYCVLFAAGVLIGINKTGIPGIGTLPVVLLALAFAPRLSAGVQLQMLCIGDLVAVCCYRKGANRKRIVRLLPCAVCGLLLGCVVLFFIRDDGVLRKVIGGIILMLSLFSLLKDRFLDPEKVPHGWLWSTFFGGLGGFTTQLANAAGPVMSLYWLSLKLDKEEFIRTNVWFFLCINWIKMPIFILEKRVTWEAVAIAVPTLPAILTGAALGILFIKRVPQKAFNGIVQLLILISAVKLIFS